jgi:glutaredoxin-like protein
MALLNEGVRAEITHRFQALEHQVKIVNFTQTFECQFCSETRTLLEEVAALSDKITLEVHNFQIDKEKAQAYGVDKIPATVIEGERDHGIRFYGIPSGYEFSTLIESIVMASKRDSGLAPQTRERLATLDGPVHLEVFVTPT